MTTEIKSESAKKNEDWMNSKWRPMMGWMYMAVCMADFVLFPIAWSLIQAVHGGNVTTQWNPITLQGAGLFHMAMGAIIGVAAFGRTQEKLQGANNGGAAAATTGFSSGSPAFSQASAGFGSTSGSFGSPAPSTNVTPTPSWGTTPTASAAGNGFQSKPMPAVGKPMDTGPLDSDYMPPRE